MKSLRDRIDAVLARARSVQPPESSPPGIAEPADLAELYRACGALDLADGTRILGRDEIAATTTWLRDDKALAWDEDLFVIGERNELVLVLDLDTRGARAGGGILEAATDGLEHLTRASMNVIGYLETRSGLDDPSPCPEKAAQAAIDAGDRKALEAALVASFYPGGERERSRAFLVLGELASNGGDERAAFDAFEKSVEARVAGAGRGAAQIERAAGWKACSASARAAGAASLADRCAELARRP